MQQIDILFSDQREKQEPQSQDSGTKKRKSNEQGSSSSGVPGVDDRAKENSPSKKRAIK
jgi:hypothetical protein